MVQGAESAARHQHNRQIPTLQLVDLQPVTRQWHHQAAGGLHHQGRRDVRNDQVIRVEADAVLLSGPMGRHRLLKRIGLGLDAVRAEVEQGLHPAAIAAVLQSALHRLPVVSVQPLHKPGTDDGFADIGVGAADHDPGSWLVHRFSIRLSTCQVRVGVSASGQARARRRH